MNPPPPMLPGVGMRHGEGEADGYRRVHGIAAVFEDLDAHVGRQRFLCPYHRVPGANRFTGVRGGAKSSR